MDRKNQRNPLSFSYQNLRYGLMSSTLALLVVSGLVFYFTLETLRDIQEVVPLLSDSFRGMQLEQSFMKHSVILLFFLAVSTVGSFLFSVYLYNRITGPIVRFEQKLEAMVNGKTSERIVLRKRDQFKNVATLINDLDEKFQKK